MMKDGLDFFPNRSIILTWVLRMLEQDYVIVMPSASMRMGHRPVAAWSHKVDSLTCTYRRQILEFAPVD